MLEYPLSPIAVILLLGYVPVAWDIMPEQAKRLNCLVLLPNIIPKTGKAKVLDPKRPIWHFKMDSRKGGSFYTEPFE